MTGLRIALAVAVAAGCAATRTLAAAYDPLARGQAVTHADMAVQDEARRREIPLRVYLPASTGPAAVVLFSHGLGGSREGYAYLGEHWAARGYVAVFLQHPGSDDSVWKEAPPGQRRESMAQAASGRNFMLRVQDVRAVLDRLESWNRAAGHTLAGRLDLARVGMSGHSFGAVTAQALSGQAFARAGARLADGRIRAAVVLSPSSPRRGDAAAAFGAVAMPWMLMTGTKDTAPIGDTDVASRLRVFPSLPPGDKYELVLADAEHSAFGDRALPGDRDPRNPNHHRAILALSTAFWDLYLRRDDAARAWLEGPGPRSVLEERDRWQLK